MKETLKKNYVKIMFIILIIIGIGVRVYKFPNAISEMNIDEIMTAVYAREIAETGKDLLGLSFPVYLLGWGGQSVVLVYLMTISVKVFGYTLFAVRLPTLIVSIISLFIFYDFVKKITNNKKIALVGLGLLAISPWHIMQSLFAWDCNMFPHFLLFAMDIFYTGILKNKKAIIYLSMIFFAITLYCYGIAIYFVPFFLLITAIYLVRKKKINVRDLIICIIIFILFAWPIIITFIMNGLRIGQTIEIFNITIPYYETLTRTTDMLFFSDNVGIQFIKNIVYLLSMIVFQSDNIEWNVIPMFGTIYHISIVFAILGIIFKIKKMKQNKKEDNTRGFILITWLILSLLTGILINETTINRLNSIWYLLLIFSAIGIYEGYNLIKHKKLYKYGLITIYTILFITFSILLYTYHVEKINLSSCFSKGFYQTLTYINEIDKKEVYYDDREPRGKLDFYVTLNKDENKEYIKLNKANEVENKLNNLEDDEILVVNKIYKDYESEYIKHEIGNFVIIFVMNKTLDN